MVVGLLSYFSAMVTAFAALMFLLTSFLGSTSVHTARAQPHRLTATARAMIAEHVAADHAAAEHMAAAVKPMEIAEAEVLPPSSVATQMKVSMAPVNDRVTRLTAKQAQKAKLAKLARDERRKMRLAELRQGPGYSSMALGYSAESGPRAAAEKIFSTIRPRR